MSTTDLPPLPSSPSPSPPHPGVVEPWDPNAHSAYYIEEIITWIKLLFIIAGFMLLVTLFAWAMHWAFTTDVPHVGKLALAGIVFSQISQCKKYMRRMRNLERWRERDLEVGNEADGEEAEAEERGSLSDRGGGAKEYDELIEEKEVESEQRGRSLSRVDRAEKGGI
jgi:hypothetical protein